MPTLVGTLNIFDVSTAQMALRGPHPYTHLISIRDPQRPSLRGLDSVPHKISFFFHDVGQDDAMYLARFGWEPPTREIVQQLIEFGRGLPEPDKTHVIAHCEAGISRSTAASMIVLAAGRPEASDDDVASEVVRARECSDPNLLMLRFANELLGRDLISASRRARAAYTRQKQSLWEDWFEEYEQAQAQAQAQARELEG